MMSNLKDIINAVKLKNSNEPEFIQAAEEFLDSVVPFIADKVKYKNHNLLQRILEPERIIIFRVPWLDDKGYTHVNRGYRVEFNSAIGPYKGGVEISPIC